ncbi:hypothetical protein [Actinoplanes ianthinogenes]|uniref:VHL beta domain-containing protein n=1 Tax=Actinoplanes ianthinogenes TaxID=122358 RepID=UPI0016703FCA|nr:hypothetical protein [Actinoplanes ianthinogenes]
MSRRRLFAAGSISLAVALTSAVLVRPGTRSTASRADAALPAPAGVDRSPAGTAPASSATTRRSEQSPHTSSSPTAGTRPSPAGAPRVVVVPAQREGQVKSLADDRSTEIQFVNDRREPVVIYWLDYRGARRRYAVLHSGGTRQQPTFVSHPWVITDLAGRALTIFLPASRPARATIT